VQFAIIDEVAARLASLDYERVRKDWEPELSASAR
jgi:hypothetical protein